MIKSSGYYFLFFQSLNYFLPQFFTNSDNTDLYLIWFQKLLPNNLKKLLRRKKYLSRARIDFSFDLAKVSECTVEHNILFFYIVF